MTKLFLDTNIWLRFFLKDNDQFQDVSQLITQIEEGKFLPYTSSVVFLEIVFVLQKIYHLGQTKIITCLQSILEVRNLTLIDKTDTKKALEYFRKYGIKYSDCLIASQIVPKMTLVTYDKELSKIKMIETSSPADYR